MFSVKLRVCLQAVKLFSLAYGLTVSDFRDGGCDHLLLVSQTTRATAAGLFAAEFIAFLDLFICGTLMGITNLFGTQH